MGIFEQQVVRHEWPIYGVIGGIGVFLGAWYLLTMVRRVFFGAVKEPACRDTISTSRSATSASVRY